MSFLIEASPATFGFRTRCIANTSLGCGLASCISLLECTYVCVYIYNMYVYIYIYTHTHTHILKQLRPAAPP